MLENREISSVPSSQQLERRPGKVCGYNPGMYAVEKSDIVILPKKAPNNGASNQRRRWRKGTMSKGKFLKSCLRPVRRDRGKH
jgi:hypothetical protein